MVTFYIHCQCDNVHVNLNTKSAGMKASGFFSERVMISVKRVQRVVVILLKARTEPAVKVNVHVLAPTDFKGVFPDDWLQNLLLHCRI